MSKNEASAPNGRLIAADAEGIQALFEHMQKATDLFNPGETMPEFVARGPKTIQRIINEMLDIIGDADMFDVIELMRLREVPITLDGYRESLADHQPAAIELVAVLMRAHGARRAIGANSNANPASSIPLLHDLARQLFGLGQFTLLAEAQSNTHGPLTALAATYVGHELNVRNKQYTHIQERLNNSLFAEEGVSALMLTALGFTYDDFLVVRAAIQKLYVDRFFEARDKLGEISQEWAGGGFATQTDARIAEGREAVESLTLHPGSRASFTADDIAAMTPISLETVLNVLTAFSVSFNGQQDPETVIKSFLRGSNVFNTAALFQDETDHFITLSMPIGTDCLRQVVETALKSDSKLWRKYDRIRAVESERLALEALRSLFGEAKSYENLKYYRPNPGVEAERLNSSATSISGYAEQTEADILFLVEDVAVCVEVKARSVSHQAREGHVQRLSADLRATIGEATSQALRLEGLIRTNAGLWLQDKSWLDLSNVREIRSVAVCLDDFGPLATGLDELVRSGVIESDRFPWITSIHDLMIIADVLDRPAEFLLYLRRRTESEVSLKYSAVDELDMFMLFLSGQMYVEPDPDRVQAEFMGIPPASRHERRRYADSAIPTQVMTHTDSLDAWIYYKAGLVEEVAEKPIFASNPSLLQIVDFLHEGFKPGWFRFSADLLNLAEDAQARVVKSRNQIISDSKRDAKPHTAVLAFAGSWGYPTLFLGSQPGGMPRDAASKRLATYALAKKHQLKSDRALMVLFDLHGSICSVRYDNRAPEEDEQMGEMGKRIGLMPVEYMSRSVPPSAQRSTKRLSPKGKRGRR
ncbi:hypothetical protein [Clavibacter michiganensis]|nr:hypothetical protein [Clavibacter michiganensis]